VLVQHFLERFGGEYGMTGKEVSGEAMEALRRYRWPGNVRELENLIRRLVALYSQQVIDVRTIETELADTTATTHLDSSTESHSLSDSVERQLRNYFSTSQGSLPAPGLYARALREFEKPLITLSLEATGGNQIKAAALLGVNRNTLRKKIRELDIEVVRSVK
jgi:two-component system nitrogen regulation response regulator GlnG